ncbi:MAG: hypothetical protein H0T79_21895 [Deltaproteobacteria bacterium]|nr:hypothetical protein [Deltaproteobacteria bacterium]
MRTLTTLIVIGSVGGLTACVDGFRGSNVQIDFAPGTPMQASSFAVQRPGELPTNVHFTLYAIQRDDAKDRLFELQRFEIHPIIDLDSPCFIDVGEHVPYPGLHVSQFVDQVRAETGIVDIANPPPGVSEADRIRMATAIQRSMNLDALAGDKGIRVVTSASEGTGYPAVATSCGGPSDQIPPPECTDADSNARRLALCEAAWASDGAFYEGTDRVLTAPLNGVANGMVVGENPINLAPIGGVQFFVDEALRGMDAYAIYTQVDGMDDEPGTLLLYGEPTTPTRGVVHVDMASPGQQQLTADMAIFVDLGEDDVQF